MEIWKDIPEFEFYQVSNMGNIKSLSRVVPTSNGRLKRNKETILKAGITSTGYKIVVLRKNNKSFTRKVHQLVAIAFLGHKPNGFKLVVDHIDNCKTNNIVSNLQIITNRENSSKDKKGGSSKYIGVTWHISKKKWYASIDIKGKSKHIGAFDNEEDAAKAYQNYLKKL